MNLIERINYERLAARKSGDKLLASTLTTVASEALSIGKAKGNRPPTDAEVIKVVADTIAGLNFTIEKCLELGKDPAPLIAEKVLLEVYMPRQLTEEEMIHNITHYVTENQWSISDRKIQGKIMAEFKKNFPNQYDGRVLSSLAQKLIEGTL